MPCLVWCSAAKLLFLTVFWCILLLLFRYAKQQITLDEYRAKAQVGGPHCAHEIALNHFNTNSTPLQPPHFKASVKQANERTAEVAQQRHVLREEVMMMMIAI
jgi:hypothetical protein